MLRELIGRKQERKQMAKFKLNTKIGIYDLYVVSAPYRELEEYDNDCLDMEDKGCFLVAEGVEPHYLRKFAFYIKSNLEQRG